MAWLKKDQDYRDLGLEPPEHIPHGEAAIRFDGHSHEWGAVGNYIECNKGEHPHGHRYDHLNQIFVGTNAQGEPVFQPVDIQKPLSNTKKSVTADD